MNLNENIKGVSQRLDDINSESYFFYDLYVLLKIKCERDTEWNMLFTWNWLNKCFISHYSL